MNHKTTDDDLKLWFSNPHDQSLRWAKACGLNKNNIKPLVIRRDDPIYLTDKIEYAHELEKPKIYYPVNPIGRMRRSDRHKELAASNPGYASWLAGHGVSV